MLKVGFSVKYATFYYNVFQTLLNIHIMYNSYSQRVGAKGSGADDFTMQSKPTGVFLHPKNNECSPQRP